MSQPHLVQVRRPKAIIFDILGTASKSGFLEKILFPYLKSNLENYVDSHWNDPEFIKVYKKIVDQSNEFQVQDQSVPIVATHDSEQAKVSLFSFLNYITENNINSPPVTRLRFKVWFDGYQQSKLRTPIYTDVPTHLKRWFAEGCKFYVFSNTWVEAQVALLRNTNHGDLTNLISGHYDNDFGNLLEPDSYRRLCTDIKVPPQDVLFLTKSSVEARAAADAGLAVVLVLTHRHNVRAVSEADRQRFPYVRTLNDLSWLEDAQQPQASTVPSLANHVPTAVSASSGAVSSRHGNSQYPGAASGTSSTKTQTGQSGVPSSRTGASASSQSAMPSSRTGTSASGQTSGSRASTSISKRQN